LKIEIVELNVQVDYVHLLVLIPPKILISQFIGTIKGRTAIKTLHKFPHLKTQKYGGNHFWARGYCVDTVDLDAEMIKKYVRFQDNKKANTSNSGIAHWGQSISSLLGLN
jgi:putative transposase